MATNPAWTDEELLLAVELIDRRGWRGGNSTTQEYIELSEILRTANFPGLTHANASFRSPNSVSLKIGNLIGAHPDIPGGLRATENERRAVQRFLEDPDIMRALAQTLRTEARAIDVRSLEQVNELDDEEINAAIEGGASYVLTLRRERSRGLRRAKIQQMERGGGELSCEVCAFDFEETYGELGKAYIEVHHRTPLYVSGEVESALDDLVLLCANCHRMIHRSGWLPLESLAKTVAANSKARNE